MFFGLFGSKKTSAVSDRIATRLLRDQVLGQVSMAVSLRKLGRSEEASQIINKAEESALLFAPRDPSDPIAQILLVEIYREWGWIEKRREVIKHLLGPDRFALGEDERSKLKAELAAIERQGLQDQKTSETPPGFTQVYACLNCGRLHNYLSLPCPHCDWHPATLLEVARSIVMSNSYSPISNLLKLSRSVAVGRKPAEIVPNLEEMAARFLKLPKNEETAKLVLKLIDEGKHEYHQSLKEITECHSCAGRILFSGSKTCPHCGSSLALPDLIVAMICFDNLLWFFEQHMFITDAEANAELVCVLVGMTNNLLRKQSPPTEVDRKFCIQQLESVKSIQNHNKSAIIDMPNLLDITVYAIGDRITSEAQGISMLFGGELKQLVRLMKGGVSQ